MQTYLLQPKDIKKLTGETFYSRGKRYFDTGKVYGLSHNSAINSWRAVVAGTHDYEVRVFFFEDEEVEASCECQAYHTYYTCKHIAAVLLAIREQALEDLAPKLYSKGQNPLRDLTNEDRLFAMRLSEAFRNKQEQTFEKKKSNPFHLQYNLQLESILGTRGLTLELKAGEGYMYVIRNIRSFIEHLFRKKSYPISKKFTYEPAEHRLSETDEAIIQILYYGAKQETFYYQQWGYGDRKMLQIPPMLARELLPYLSSQACMIKESGTKEFALSYHQTLPKFSFQVSESDRQFDVRLHDLKKYDYLADYNMLYKHGAFYQVAPEQEEVLNLLYSLLPYNSDGHHRIDHTDMEGLVSYVLPELETIGEVSMSPAAADKIVQEDLKAQVFLDFHQWTLTAKVMFHYGQVAIDPFQKEVARPHIIKRNHQKEQSVMDLIESAEFKYDGEIVYIEDEEQIGVFLHEYLPALHEVAEVFTDKSVQSLMDKEKQELIPTIEMDQEGSWLDIRFEVEGINEDDITSALRAAIEKKKYFRLSDGALLSLTTDSFQRFQRLAEELDLSSKEIEGSTLHVSQVRSLQVDEVLQAEKDEKFTQLVNRLKHPHTFEIDPPETLEADLRPYQLTGFRWLKTLSTYGLGGILADDMGLGKTVQTISYLLHEKEQGMMEKPALIISPASLIYNWKKEVEKFAPSFTVKMITGDPESRRDAIQGEEADIWITSYPLIRQDAEQYKEISFHAMILDESQAIKNETTKTAGAVRTIKARHRFALSGTPIENSLTELWSIFRTLMPGFYTSKRKFLQMKPAQIAHMTRPFILRRMKTEVLDELPDKIETVQYSELTRQQKEVYLAYVERIQNDIQTTIAEKGFQKGKLEILAGLTRLRQICCHPAMFLENYKGTSGKMEQLKELVDELKSGGHRLLIFSQFSSMLTMLFNEFNETGLDAFYLDGSTKSEHRMEMVERFNQGEKDAFFISLKAGGTGLNLTGADTVILYDLWWNPAIEEQAAGRAHRIGQERVVQVIRMISEGTIEEKIYQLQQKKRDLVDQIIQPGESMLTSLSEEEIRGLFV